MGRGIRFDPTRRDGSWTGKPSHYGREGETKAKWKGVSTPRNGRPTRLRGPPSYVASRKTRTRITGVLAAGRASLLLSRPRMRLRVVCSTSIHRRTSIDTETSS